ncbi:site-2 protease family protein [Candidatus Woesearchaeota archaeon]|nr:site-2 protease family protein [Candidatus Woesearchaeota archaeon]
MGLDTFVAVAFLVILGLVLWKKRSKLEVKKLLFPIFYILMYRSQWGLEGMDFWARKLRKPLLFLGYAGILFGFLGMLFICAELVLSTVKLISQPGVPSVQLVLPVQAKGVFYVPLLYWILSIFIVAVVHEFGHGVVARAHKIPLKGTGFAFLSFIIPILPAAYVEPDETSLMHRRGREKLSVYAAGPFANILLGLLVFGALFALSPVSNAIFEPAGVEVVSFTEGSAAELAGIEKGAIITEVGDQDVRTVDDLHTVVASLDPEDLAIVDTLDGKKFSFMPNRDPADASHAFLGVRVTGHMKEKITFLEDYPAWLADIFGWFTGLLFWIFALSLGIGLFNLLPVGPLDGGHMSRVVLTKFIKNKKRALKVWMYLSLFFISVILVNLLFGVFA